jgi:hypothetical protein
MAGWRHPGRQPITDSNQRSVRSQSPRPSLARLEMETLLYALLDRVGRLEADAPTLSMNNTLHGFSRLPLTLRG